MASYISGTQWVCDGSVGVSGVCGGAESPRFGDCRCTSCVPDICISGEEGLDRLRRCFMPSNVVHEVVSKAPRCYPDVCHLPMPWYEHHSKEPHGEWALDE